MINLDKGLSNLWRAATRPWQEPLRQRSYRDIAAVGGQNSDWLISAQGEDGDLWMNAWLLTARMRSLFKENPAFVKHMNSMLGNIFGENGIMLRMKVLETEPRVVNTADEAKALIAYEERINKLRQWAEKRTGREIEQYRAFKLADAMERSSVDAIISRKATVQVGDPDIFANLNIERWWRELHRAENIDVRGRRNYHVLRQLRLINGMRDGDFFIRMIRDPKLKPFGFAIQMISAEWCDRFLNATLPNGNEIIMGIEWERTAWGLGKAVAFYFITRQPRDWQFTMAGAFNGGGTPGQLHQRIDASEIIHYARPVDAESTRPAPWCASAIPKARQLDQYELAEVIAAREAACKTGFYYSDILPEGGLAQEMIPDLMTGLSTEVMGPGEIRALKYGVKYQERDPKHPNGNFDSFRKAMGRSITAGMPGGDYNVNFNDLENINFSAGRLGRLDTNEMCKMIQRFDIDVAETPIFENALEMGLIMGAIPLPFTKDKFRKFNKPVFQGRRWAQVDEVKAVNAAALRIANKLSSRGRECADEGVDFEDNAFELAEEEMLLESLGLESATTVEQQPAATDAQDTVDGETSPATGGTQKPSPTKKPGTNGKHEPDLEFSRL